MDVLEEIFGIGEMDKDIVELWYDAYRDLGGEAEKVRQNIEYFVRNGYSLDENVFIHAICDALKELVAKELEKRGYTGLANDVYEVTCYVNALDSAINHPVLGEFLDYDDIDDLIDDLLEYECRENGNCYKNEEDDEE